jgi:hypothetical protein
MGYLREDRRAPTAKLSHTDVLKIKHEKELLIKKLARDHGVSPSTIRNIIMEKTWGHIRLKRV